MVGMLFRALFPRWLLFLFLFFAFVFFHFPLLPPLLVSRYRSLQLEFFYFLFGLIVTHSHLAKCSPAYCYSNNTFLQLAKCFCSSSACVRFSLLNMRMKLCAFERLNTFSRKLNHRKFSFNSQYVTLYMRSVPALERATAGRHIRWQSSKYATNRKKCGNRSKSLFSNLREEKKKRTRALDEKENNQMREWNCRCWSLNLLKYCLDDFYDSNCDKFVPHFMCV